MDHQIITTIVIIVILILIIAILTIIVTNSNNTTYYIMICIYHCVTYVIISITCYYDICYTMIYDNDNVNSMLHI